MRALLALSLFAGLSTASSKAGWEAQLGAPLVSEIESMQGGLEEFTWDIVWDREGVAYLARERIWRWDGTQLDPVGPDIFSEMHAIAMDRQDRLLVGGINEFGIYDPESETYDSLTERLPAGHRQFGRAWAIYDDGNAIWMGSSNRLFRVGPESTDVYQFEGKHRVVFHFLKSGVYAHEAEVGLWKIEAGEKIIVNENEWLSSTSILFLEDQPDGDLLGVSNSGLFEIEDFGRGYVNRHVFGSLDKVPVSAVERIDKNRFLIGTLGKGLHLLSFGNDLTGLFVGDPTYANALVLGIGYVPNGGMWVSINSRVDSVKTHQTAMRLDEIVPSIKDLINDAVLVGDDLLISSNSGIFLLESSEGGSVKRVFLDEAFGGLFPTNAGVLFHNYDELNLLCGSIVNTLHEFGREIWAFTVVGERIVVGFSDRIGVYRLSGDNKLELEWEHPLGSGLRVLRADGTGTVWGWDPMGPLVEFQWREADGFNEVRHEEIEGLSLSGQRHQFTITEKGPVLLVGNRIARRDGTDGQWEVEALTLPPGTVEAITVDYSGDTLSGWLVSWDPSIQSHFLTQLTWDADEEPVSQLLPWIGMNDLGRIKTIRYFGGEDPRLLIGGMKGVLWADPGLSHSIPKPARPVLYHNGKRIWKNTRVTADYGEDVLRFRYSSPGGNLTYPVRYETRLAGRDEEWSGPSGITFRELGQVWEGRYTFEVRAVDPFGRYSPVARVALHVHPPWFRSLTAWILYGVCVVCLVWLLYVFLGLRHRRRQIWLEEQVRTRTMELERANRFKDDFIANLSHEIRNPLNGVIGSIRQLKPDVALPDRTLKSLRGAAHYLQTTVEEVLDFAKLESGEITIEQSRFDIGEIVSGVVEIHRPAARGKGLSLTTRLQVPDHMAVVSDARKLEQIIGNLVGNAVKFTHSGNVTLGVRIKPEGDGEGALRIWVEDTGRGIPGPEQERIFDKFYQGKQASRKTTGTGIGLSLVRSFVDSLGGQLTLESEPGKGSTFIVNLQVGLKPLEALPGTLSEYRSYDGVRVLIVEDLEYNRTILEDFLAEIGCETESADSGNDGLTLAMSRPFSLILLDWELPGLSGLEVARALRADPQFPGQTLIAGMTAYATAEDQQACLDAGMDVFLSKPISNDQLVEILDRVAGRAPLLKGPGLLMEMTHGDNLQKTYTRWLGFHKTYRSELEEAIELGNPDAVGKAAHRLLGHLRMLDLERLPGVATDLMTAAKAGDSSGIKQEWDELASLLEQLERELEDQVKPS